ncbi:MAG: NADH:ubiquinone oxidoreductase subunit NDUFA12 [Paracoccaceae bacterium]
MSIGKSLLRLLTWWDGQTLGTQLYTWRKGVRVGEDDLGNVYYTNRDNSRRWVIFPEDAEATKVSPEWHGWLHKTFDEPPTTAPLVHQSWEIPHRKNLTGTPMAYAPAGSIRNSGQAEKSDYEAWQPE